MLHALLKDIKEGVSLLPVVKHISQDKINYFSVISDAAEAIHVDPAFAEKTLMNSTLANGFMSFGYLCEVMENNFGGAWLETGQLEVRFVGAVRPGDSIIAGGIIEKISYTEEGLLITCNISVSNQHGTACVIGTGNLLCGRA